jgi:hypothetical protein
VTLLGSSVTTADPGTQDSSWGHALCDYLCISTPRSAKESKWARADGGKECYDCRGLLRVICRGDSAAKKTQKEDLATKCKCKIYVTWYISPEGPLGKWLAANREQRATFESTLLVRVLSVIKECGFIGREVRGVFYHTDLFEGHFKKKAHPDELTLYMGRKGVIVPRGDGEVLPIGAIELFNETRDIVQDKRIVEHSGAASSNLIDNQVDTAYRNMAAQAQSTAGPTYEYKENGELSPLAKPKPEDAPAGEDEDEKPSKGSKKRRVLKKEPSDLTNESDSWFNSAPKDKKRSAESTASSSRATASVARPSRGDGDGGGRARGSGASRGASSGASTPTAGSRRKVLKTILKKEVVDNAGELSWRDRANKVRKVGACEMSLQVAEEYVSQFASNDAYDKIKLDHLRNAVKQLESHRNDETLSALLREPDGSFSSQGLDLREKLEQRETVLRHILVFLEVQQTCFT